MAVKKKRNAPLQALGNARDEAVEAALGDQDPLYGKMASKAARFRSMTPGQRRKAKYDAQRNKATYDLPEELTNLIDSLAETERTNKSHMAGFILSLGLHRLVEQPLDFGEFKELSPTPRYDYKLHMPDPPTPEELNLPPKR
ncbi:MAG: hypothetical protein K8R77_13010 [Anaerolineaceae bacterium]|nr:hypothetical protein [Anaerolineaceae bacterium]